MAIHRLSGVMRRYLPISAAGGRKTEEGKLKKKSEIGNGKEGQAKDTKGMNYEVLERHEPGPLKGVAPELSVRP